MKQVSDTRQQQKSKIFQWGVSLPEKTIDTRMNTGSAAEKIFSPAPANNPRL